jgi:hypothetical protein
MNKVLLTLLMIIVLLATGCSTPVLRQDIPVSTNPMGATIYANGKPVGKAPTTISLERTRDHIVTLSLENYRQEDVVVRRQYQQQRTLLKAVQSGVDTGLFFNNPSMGVSRGIMDMQRAESTGDAYLLVPVAVKVDLTPLPGTAAAAAPQAAAKQKQPDPSVMGMENAPADTRGTVRDAAKIAVGAATAKSNPLEAKKEISSSSKTTIKPDGTKVQEKSSTKVGVSVDPRGLVDMLDILFK